MRLNNSDAQFRPGPVRCRRQWVFFGLALGVIAALALNSDTRSIVRKELATGIPFRRGLGNQVQQIEFSGVGSVDQTVLDAAATAAGNAKNDVPLQIACALFRRLADAHRLREGQPNWSEYEAENPSDAGIQAALRLTRESVIQEVWRAYPDSAVASAAYIREFLAADVKNDRAECYWITGNKAPEDIASVAQPHMLAGSEAPGQPDVLYESQLQAIEQASKSGAQSAPQNAFFPMALAYVHYMEHKGAEAIRDVDRAAHCPVYNDYWIDVARGWQRLDTALYGTPDSNAETNRFEDGTDFGCLLNFRKVGEITVWQAIELEHHGFYSQGVALRMRIASIAAAMSRCRPQGLYNGTFDLIDVTAIGPGGNYIRPRTTNSQLNQTEAQYEYAYRCSTLYTEYLETHGFTAEADWYKPIFKAQYRQANRIHIATDESGGNNSEAQQNWTQWIQPIAFQAYGYWILAEITLMVFAGLVLGSIGYLRRFAPRREVYWTRAQWGTVFGGFLMAISCSIFCAILYKGPAVWPLVLILLYAVALVQFAVRRLSDSDSPIALLLHTLCFAVCLLIIAGTSALGLNNLLGALAQQAGNYAGSTLPSTEPFVLALLVFPALLLCCVIAKCRVQYKGVPSGLFHGTRRIVVPVISMLLLLWAVDIAITIGLEKDNRHSICENLGLKSDAELR